jgi:putative 4-mercaptohistidine N1-methyltranferase
LDRSCLPLNARALDLGCGVGGASFELARFCSQVVGIDLSQRFISIARRLRRQGTLLFQVAEEGLLAWTERALVPPSIERRRVQFECGDASSLRADLGKFDVILMANLIDRLPQPAKCLRQMARRVNPGGQLIITSPYTWLDQYTPRRNWLGGRVRNGWPERTIDALKRILLPDFILTRRGEIPFIIREHARKYQLGIAEATTWRRRKAR